MPRKFIRKLISKFSPGSENLQQHRALRLFGTRLTTALLHPELWRLNRYSVASGIAIGMFCGLIPGPFQILGAMLCALWLRANLPLAALTTVYTNPLTIVPLYLVAYQLGNFILRATHVVNQASVASIPPDWVWSTPMQSVQRLLEWMISLGPALALGIFLLASLLAVVSYIVVRVLWSLRVRIAYWRRVQKRKHRKDRRNT